MQNEINVYGRNTLELKSIALILFHKYTQPVEAGKKTEVKEMFPTIVLCGLFVVIRGITDVGLIDDAASLIVNAGGNNLFVLYTIIVWGSVLFSAFIDNIPYVATMLPILTSITALLGIEPYVLYFGLLTGATLGGNITPIGMWSFRKMIRWM